MSLPVEEEGKEVASTLEGMRLISVLLGAAGLVAVGHALISLR